MKSIRDIFPKAFRMLLSFTVLCGILYTLVITVVAQLIFPYEADGSIIEVNGKRYGSELIGQQFTGEGHLWGRIMKLDTQTFIDSDGKALLYAVPANLSPASKEYEALVAERVERIRTAHPDQEGVPIPVDLVTCSGSGLDPHISVAAAEYQVGRIAAYTSRTEAEVSEIMAKYTTGRFLGVFGEPVVNVLQVNLSLDGILP